MIFSISELEQLFNKVLVYLGDKNIQKICFPEKHVYYPRVWHKNANFCVHKCFEYVIGSLNDDVNGLQNVVNGKNELWELDLQRLGALLTATGALLEENIGFPTDKTCAPMITLSELQLIFKIIIKFLKSSNVGDISFEGTKDYYCKIDYKDINFCDKKFVDCPPFAIGSLTKNIVDLKRVLIGAQNMDGLMLQKLGAILVALGEDMLA